MSSVSVAKKFGMASFKQVGLALMGQLLALSSSHAATVVPSSIQVATGTASGNISSISVEDGRLYNFYTDARGNLRIEFKFTGLTNMRNVAIKLKQNRASDVFTIQAETQSGFVSIGTMSGQRALRSASFRLPSGVLSSGRVRLISNVGADDGALDLLVVNDAGGGPVATPTPAPTPVATPTPTPAPTPVAGGIKLPPIGVLSWDWQIGAGSDAQIVVPSGVKLMDVDVFSTSAAKVAQMKAQGVYTVCYINAGSYQPGLPDSGQYPSYLFVQADPDWAGEYFLDVTDVFKPNSVLAKILRERMRLCKEKGFDAMEPDNLQNDENVRGGKITTQQQIDFNGWIADTAHEYGLAVFQKNGPDKILLKDRTGKMMVEKFDGILNEECQQYNECGPLAEYVKRGKLALNVEYSVAPNCTLSGQLSINTMRRDLDLRGPAMSGYRRQSCQ